MKIVHDIIDHSRFSPSEKKIILMNVVDCDRISYEIFKTYSYTLKKNQQKTHINKKLAKAKLRL